MEVGGRSSPNGRSRLRRRSKTVGPTEAIASLEDACDPNTRWQIVFTRVDVDVRDTESHHIQQRMKKEGDVWKRVQGRDRFVRRLWYDWPMQGTEGTRDMDTRA